MVVFSAKNIHDKPRDQFRIIFGFTAILFDTNEKQQVERLGS